MNNDRKNVDKGIGGFIAAAMVAVFAGICVAAAQLVFRPVSVTPLKTNDPKTSVVCVHGNDIPSSQNYVRNAKDVVRDVPGIYVFSEGDINALINKYIARTANGAFIQLDELPNVRFLEGGRVQISVVVRIPYVFDKRKFTYQVRGKIVSDGFLPEMGWFGQCPIPFLNSFFLERIRGSLNVDEEVKGLDRMRAWAKLSRDGNDLFVDVAETPGKN